MSLSDPIGDMLARIKNAQVRNHSKVSLPSYCWKIGELEWRLGSLPDVCKTGILKISESIF